MAGRDTCQQEYITKMKKAKKVKKEGYYASIKRRDPAARNNFQIFFLYPGVIALRWYRFAHFLYTKMKLKFIGEMIMHSIRQRTGIEIHPAAKIGKNVFIDHGMGVTVGQTAIIGNNVLIYQGVLLGGRTLERIDRHPIIEDDVVIGANARVLGRVTVKKGAIVGSGSIVLKDVDENQKIHAGQVYR